MTTAPDHTLLTIYKITTRSEWNAARQSGVFMGSEDDRRDGFIHLSAEHQLAGTARKYFCGKADLVLIAFTTTDFGPQLKWEPSRGGDLFPHLYAPLPVAKALWLRALPLGRDGEPLVSEALG